MVPEVGEGESCYGGRVGIIQEKKESVECMKKKKEKEKEKEKKENNA